MDIQTIIQGGAVGIAIAILIFSWKRDKMNNETQRIRDAAMAQVLNDHNRIIEEHFKEDREDRKQETDAKLKYATAFHSMAESVRDCPLKNSPKKQPQPA